MTSIFYGLLALAILWVLYYDYIYKPVDKRKLKVKVKTIKRKKR